jgi:hypothetical protein
MAKNIVLHTCRICQNSASKKEEVLATTEHKEREERTKMTFSLRTLVADPLLFAAELTTIGIHSVPDCV